MARGFTVIPQRARAWLEGIEFHRRGGKTIECSVSGTILNAANGEGSFHG